MSQQLNSILYFPFDFWAKYYWFPQRLSSILQQKKRKKVLFYTKRPCLSISVCVCGRFRGVQYLGQDFIMYDGVGGEQHQNRLQQLQLLQSVLHQLPQHVDDVPRRRLQTHSLTHLNEPLIRHAHRWDSNVINLKLSRSHNITNMYNGSSWYHLVPWASS